MEPEQIDLTRLNRKDRRRIHTSIQGRNQPFVKERYKSLAEFNELRLKEIEADKQNNVNTTNT